MAGRPKTDIDREQFEKLCALCLTESEIASFFYCSRDTINAYCKRTYKDEHGNPMTFSAIHKIISDRGKTSKKAKLAKMADKNPMLMKYYADNVLDMNKEKNARIERLKAETEYTKAQTAQMNGDNKDPERYQSLESLINQFPLK